MAKEIKHTSNYLFILLYLDPHPPFLPLKHGSQVFWVSTGRNELHYQKMPLTWYKKKMCKNNIANAAAVWLYPRHFKALFKDAARVWCEFCATVHQEDFPSNHATIPGNGLKSKRDGMFRCDVIARLHFKIHNNPRVSVRLSLLIE